MPDTSFMQRAIELAALGKGFTAPNPLVGAVIVKNNIIIGEGYHKKIGGLHAEREALASLTQSCEDADMYVTLEPCCHFGKQPPCTQAIIDSKIKRVIIGSRDPNPLVAGKGVRILRDAGIEVIEDFMRAQCDELNPAFFHYITTGMPYVALKFAETADGKIAAYTGKSKWITNDESRRHVHSLRGEYSAILAGIGTVLADDPMLNCRVENAHQPLRIIVDSKLRIPLDSNICKTADKYKTLVAYADADEQKIRSLNNMGVETVKFDRKDGKVDLTALMKYLGSVNISSVLIEGGGEINEAALKSGIVSHIYAYIAPKLLGGKDAKTPVEGAGFASPNECVQMSLVRTKVFGDDVLLEYDVRSDADVHRDN